MGAYILALATGNEYRAFLDVGAESIQKNLSQRGVPTQVYINDNITETGFRAKLAEVASKNEAVVILLAPQSATVHTINLVIARALGLVLCVNTDAHNAVNTYIGINVDTHENITDFITLPQNAQVIANSSGLVQGYVVNAKKQILAVLPVKPGELVNMLSGALGARLDAFFAEGKSDTQAQQVVSPIVIKAADIGNTPIYPRVKKLLAENENIACSYQKDDYRITFSPQYGKFTDVSQNIKYYMGVITDTIGDCIYANEDRTMLDAVMKLLTEKHIDIAIGEDGTNGYFGKVLLTADSTDMVISTDAVYHGEEMMKKLKISDTYIEQNNIETANEIALCVKKQSQKKIGIAVLLVGTLSRTLLISITDGEHMWNKTISAGENNNDRLIYNGVLHMLNMLRLYATHYEKIISSALPVKKKKHSFLSLFKK